MLFTPSNCLHHLGKWLRALKLLKYADTDLKFMILSCNCKYPFTFNLKLPKDPVTGTCLVNPKSVYKYAEFYVMLRVKRLFGN